MLASLLWHLHPLLVPAEFAIHHRPGRPTRVRGRIARGKVPAIGEFFRRDLNPSRPVTVFGSKAGGRMHVRLYGLGDRRDEQRVRNFLIEHLR